MLPSISVIIPVFNQDQFVAEAVESALAQTFPPAEVIAVDDGSTDESARVLAGFGPRVRVIRQPNGGVSVARNRGVAEATGVLVAFLDADDAWLPQKLERQVRRFVDEPELGLVHCGGVVVDREGKPLWERLDGMEGWVAEDFLLFRQGWTATGSTAVVPRSLILELGGFDPQLPPTEDWDLSYRIACRRRVGFIPEALVKYRLHGANGHMNIDRMERGMLLGFRKAFESPAPQTALLRHQAYGHLHMILAGSYFHARHYGPFARNALQSLWHRPALVTRLLGFPVRWMRRRRVTLLSHRTPPSPLTEGGNSCDRGVKPFLNNDR
jgi:glycosyltransferase involved in cell wall biosynthesis